MYERPRPPRGLAYQRRNTPGKRPHPASRRPPPPAASEIHWHRATPSRHKHALIRLLERERKKLEQAERLGLLIKWSKEPGYIAIHDPTTGDWHDVPASGCPPSVVESARAHRKRRGRR